MKSAWLLIPLLSGCALLFGPSPELQAQRTGEVVTLITTVGPQLSVASTAEITSWLPVERCHYTPSDAGATRAVTCDVRDASSDHPVTLTLTTAGTVSANVFDGLRPVTKPVVVPRTL